MAIGVVMRNSKGLRRGLDGETRGTLYFVALIFDPDGRREELKQRHEQRAELCDNMNFTGLCSRVTLKKEQVKNDMWKGGTIKGESSDGQGTWPFFKSELETPKCHNHDPLKNC